MVVGDGKVLQQDSHYISSAQPFEAARLRGTVLSIDFVKSAGPNRRKDVITYHVLMQGLFRNFESLVHAFPEAAAYERH